jgi:hypothetical protein
VKLFIRVFRVNSRLNEPRDAKSSRLKLSSE